MTTEGITKIYFVLSGGATTHSATGAAMAAAEKLLASDIFFVGTAKAVMVIERDDGAKEVATFTVACAKNKVEVKELDAVELLEVLEVVQNVKGDIVVIKRSSVTGALVENAVVARNGEIFKRELVSYLEEKLKEIEEGMDESIS